MNYPDKIKCLELLDEIERIAHQYSNSGIDDDIERLRSELLEGFNPMSLDVWKKRVKLPWERGIFSVPSIPTGKSL